MERIDRIELRGLLPEVFREEDLSASRIWREEVEFRRGEIILVEAHSGGGKSSLLSFIYGERRDYIGGLLFNGRESRELTPGEWQEIRREHLAYLPQDLLLFPELTAMENVRIKNNLTHTAQGGEGYCPEEQIRDYFHRLGLDERADWPVGRLSVGQRQRVAIIRAICQPFDFLLLDEPVSHLDERNNEVAARMLAEAARERGAGIISTSVGNPIKLDYDKTYRL